MDLLMLFLALLLLSAPGTHGSTFKFVNNCEYTVWPGILASSGTPPLESTGFELPENSFRSFQAPTGWSGRFWGRTGCKFNGTGPGSCSTGDCGSGQEECNGAGGSPPATLGEITLGSNTQDFYDVSLVDGYNVAMIIEPAGGSGMCATTGCVTDLNRYCPVELRVSNGDACKSACEAFGSPEYCCSGAYNTPATCKPSVYAALFKMVCPRSYSYAYDDPTSTFTCMGADYTITFCPSIPSSGNSVSGADEQPSRMSGALSPGALRPAESGSEPEAPVNVDGPRKSRVAKSDSPRRYHSYCTSKFLLIALSFIFFL